MSNALIYCIKPQNNYIFIVSSKVNYSSSYECFYKRFLLIFNDLVFFEDF